MSPPRTSLSPLVKPASLQPLLVSSNRMLTISDQLHTNPQAHCPIPHFQNIIQMSPFLMTLSFLCKISLNVFTFFSCDPSSSHQPLRFCRQHPPKNSRRSSLSLSSTCPPLETSSRVCLASTFLQCAEEVQPRPHLGLGGAGPAGTEALTRPLALPARGRSTQLAATATRPAREPQPLQSVAPSPLILLLRQVAQRVAHLSRSRTCRASKMFEQGGEYWVRAAGLVPVLWLW